MSHYLNYEGKKINFSLPGGWHVISDKDEIPSVSGVKDVLTEVRSALDHPVGSLRIEEIARPGMEVVVLFDDLMRPTPVPIALPEVMDRLNLAGIPDEQIYGICAVGTHPMLDRQKLKTKVGEQAYRRLEGRISSHDCYAKDNVVIGRTGRGTLVEVNQKVAFADLIIGIGSCFPHPVSGFGGGCKILMPGVSSYRSVGEHHFTWMRHMNSRTNVLDGNYFYEEIVDAGRLARLAFKMDFIPNEKGEICRIFAGDPVAEHREASRYLASKYLVSLPKMADITITSSFPQDTQAGKALHMVTSCTRQGGTIIWLAPQKKASMLITLQEEIANRESANDFYRRLVEGDIPDHLKALGISTMMQVVFFKEWAENFNIIHVTQGLSQEFVEKMGFAYASDLQQAIDQAAEKIPEAGVAVFPSGGNIIPEVTR